MPAQPVHAFALFAPELKELLARKAVKELRRALNLISPLDLAEGWESFAPDDQLLLFKLLSRRKAVVLFETLEVEQQAKLIEALERERLAAAAAVPDLSGLPSSAPDGGGPLPPPAPPARMDAIIRALHPRTLRKLSRFLSREGASSPVLRAPSFPAGTVGSLMHAPSVPLDAGLTARQALERFQAQLRPGSPMPVSMLFVVGRDGALLCAVELRDLLAAPPDLKLSEMASSVELIKLKPTADQEEAARLFERFELSAAPVVDDAGRLIGILTTDDIVQVVEKEATEDIQKVGGSEALEAPYFTVEFWQLVKKRAGWLTVLFVGESLTATAMGYYEGEIQRAVVLALFIPLIVSSGGNAGSQATTLIIRSLALREMHLRDWWRVMRREAAFGLVLGAILGTIGLLRIVLWQQWHPSYGGHYLLVAVTVSVSVLGVVMWGTLSGSMLPFVLRRLGLDPASASAPFVATMVDVTGLVIYFSMASLLLRGTLL